MPPAYHGAKKVRRVCDAAGSFGFGCHWRRVTSVPSFLKTSASSWMETIQANCLLEKRCIARGHDESFTVQRDCSQLVRKQDTACGHVRDKTVKCSTAFDAMKSRSVAADV
tara:strand:+ start:2670 stop:3002 length:333 start_codon:yes stop_codon:yes gene_type:complete